MSLSLLILVKKEPLLLKNLVLKVLGKNITQKPPLLFKSKQWIRNKLTIKEEKVFNTTTGIKDQAKLLNLLPLL